MLRVERHGLILREDSIAVKTTTKWLQLIGILTVQGVHSNTFAVYNGASKF